MMFDILQLGNRSHLLCLAGGWILGLYFPFDLIIGRA
jgi:hypothetical protein